MKKSIAAALSVSMAALCAFSSLAGCSTPSGASSAAAASASAAASAAASGTNSERLSDTLVTLNIMRNENSAQPITTDNTVFQYIKEHLNVELKIEAIPDANYTDKKQVRIATNDLPDMALVTQSDLINYASSGVFVNLSDSIKNNKMPNFSALINGSYSDLKKLEINGSFFGTPILCRYQQRGAASCVIRKDLLTKNNLAVPTTFDELLTVLTKLKSVYPNMIPFTNRKGGSVSGTVKLLQCMAYTLGSGDSIYYDQDVSGGTYLYGPANTQFKEVLTYLNKMYAAGLLDKDYASNTADQWKQKMSSGTAMCYFDNIGFANDFNIALQQNDKDAQLVTINTMKNSLGQTRNWFYDKNWPTSSYVISAKSSKADICVKLLDWYYSEKGCDVANFGVEGSTYTYVNNKPQMTNATMDKYLSANSPSYEMMSKLGIGYLAFTPYVDASSADQMNNYVVLKSKGEDALKEFIANGQIVTNDKGMREPVLDPSFTSDEAAKIKQIKSALDNILLPEYDKYITGQEPISKYDEVIAKAKAAGATELEKIYNTANERAKKSAT